MNGYVSTLALVFDFDDTLTDDSTTALLTKHGIDARRFWTRDAKGLIQKGYDPVMAYLKLLLSHIGQGRPLGPLRNSDLRAFGARLALYAGLPGLLDDLRATARKAKNVEIEFYVVSGGLREIIMGNKFIRTNFSGVYGCELAGDDDDGMLKHIKRCVTFTEKTRFLFEINKGLSPSKTRRNPYLVNQDIPHARRRIPFRNMIYVGDGLTDIPCFSLVKHFEGTTFGVFNPGEEGKAKRALVEFLKPDRVISMHAPRYGRNDELGALIRAAVAMQCSRTKLERQETSGRAGR